MTKIALLSDTHDNIPPAEGVIQQIKALGPDHVFHCGDITSPSTLALFEGLPLEAVFGNCDFDTQGLQEEAQRIGIKPLEYIKEFEINGKKICITHGDRDLTLSHIIQSGTFDYVFHGHTHEKRDVLFGNTRVINSGAFTRVETISYCVLDLSSNRVNFHEY